MLLHDTALAPNPRRVRIFLAEKGIEVPAVQVDIGKAENRQPELLAGDRFSIADTTALVGIDLGRPSSIGVAPDPKNLARWHQAVSARPSASA